MAYVTNIAALRALTSGSAGTVDVEGYSSPGDGGGGPFYYISSDTTSADNGVTIIVDAAGNRWHRNYSGSIDVRWAGAKLDGSTDDSAAIITASSLSQSILFPTGQCRTLSNITINVPVEFLWGASLFNVGSMTLGRGVVAPLFYIFRGSGPLYLEATYQEVGYPEWWGATFTSSTNQNAINACIAACAITQLQARTYSINAPILIQKNGAVLRGASETQTDQGAYPYATVIDVNDGRVNGIHIGDPSSESQPATFTEFVRVEDLTVLRTRPIENPLNGYIGAPTGVVMRWCVNCHVTRVLAREHSFGFYMYGTVENYLTNCSSLRYTAGLNTGNDFWAGFFADYANQHLSANGNNASLYLNRCRAFSNYGGQGSPGYSYNAGFQAYGGFVDLYLDQFESGSTQFGIDCTGSGTSGTDYLTEDLIINDCVIDQAHDVCLRVQTGGLYTNVQIHGCYLNPQATGTALHLNNLFGMIGVSGCQSIRSSAHTGTGLSATSVDGLTASGNIWAGLEQPITLSDCTNFRLADTVSNPSGTTTYPAINLTGCQRGIIDCNVKGVSGAFSSGVRFSGIYNATVEVRASGINPAAISGGSTNKVFDNGTPVTSAGPFGNNNLAQGIMN